MVGFDAADELGVFGFAAAEGGGAAADGMGEGAVMATAIQMRLLRIRVKVPQG